MKNLYLSLLFLPFIVGIVSAEPVVKDEILLSQGTDSYQSVRHIVIKGTDQEIGKVLGDIAQKDYGITELVKYPDSIYAKAADIYMRDNYPELRERSQGVAMSYKEDYRASLSVFNQLVYDAGPWNGCSSVYYPPSYTTTGGGLLGHNMDYQLCSLDALLKLPADNVPNMFTRNFVIELYPDKGYASVGVGTGDLLSVVTGMNEKGLIAVLHTDNYTMINTDPKSDISGLIFPTQILRRILDRCESVDEAKIVILNNKISLTFEPAHLLIADTSGRSVCVEINPKNARIEFTENGYKPQIFTNHPIYRFPGPGTFPQYKPFEKDSTFARYNDLSGLIDSKKVSSPADVLNNQMQVVARWNNPGRGQHVPIPNRTIWTEIYDQKKGEMEVRFYLKDGKIDPKTGDPDTLEFSKPFKFELKR